MRIEFLDQIFHIGTNVIMKANISIFFNLACFKLLAILFHAIYVFAFLWRLHIFDYASGKISSVYLSLLLFEHLEFKSKQLLDYLSPEFDHLLNAKSIRMIWIHTLNRLLNWINKFLHFRPEISRLKTNGLLNKSIIVSAYIC